MSAIASNLQAVRQRIANAEKAAGRRAGGVRLVAVSKSFSAQAILTAAAAGQRDFGENYVQEALEKIARVKATLAGQGIGALPQWHMIGPIQSNKTQAIAEHFDWVHSIDRLKVAQRLSAQRPDGLAPLQVCLQVNVSAESTKSGVAPEQLSPLAHAVAGLPRLCLRGLMAIPEPDAAPGQPGFALLARLRDELRADGVDCDDLSIGMSADFEAAIAAGATLIRVGTAIFGERHAD